MVSTAPVRTNSVYHTRVNKSEQEQICQKKAVQKGTEMGVISLTNLDDQIQTICLIVTDAR